MTASELVLAAPARLGGVRLLCIDGPAGSGKTTLARATVRELGERGVSAGLVRADHFATWDDPFAWWPRLVHGVLDPLRHGRAGRFQRMVWSDGWPRLADWHDVEVPEVLVLEGVSTARRSVTGWCSAAVWVEHPDPASRLERAVARDGERHRAPHTRWQRYERGWFAVDGTRERADLLVET